MNRTILRTVLLYAGLCIGFILVDLVIDSLVSYTSGIYWPHLIFATVVLLTSFTLLVLADRSRKRAEDVLRQSRDELEARVQERTLELERANAALQTEMAERQRAQEAILHLSSFPQVNPNPVLEIDAAGKVIFSNPAAMKELQRLDTVDDVRAFLPDDLDVILQELAQKKESQFDREVQVGSAIFGETIHLTPAYDAMRIYARDITDRKRAEQDLLHSLAESQQRQAEISALLASSRAVLEEREFENAAHSIFTACKNLLGAAAGYVALVTDDNAQSRPVILDPGDLPCLADPSLPMPIRGLREQAYRSGQAVYENDFAHSQWVDLLPEGHVCLDNVLFAPLVVNGIAVGLLGLANKDGGFNENDIRLASAFAELAAIALVNKRTVEMLTDNEERFRSVVQAANDAILSVDSQGNIVLWNNAAERIFGYTAAEIIGQPFTSIIPDHIRQSRESEMRRALVNGQSSIIGRLIETTGLKKDGSEFPIELSLANWKAREGLFFTATIRDVTERKQSEVALRQAQAELVQSAQEQKVMEERQRLARELHDSVSQELYGISLGAHAALALFDSDQSKVLEALNYILAQAEAGITEMRALIFELRPESLEAEGLVAALTKQGAALQARHGIPVILNPCDEPGMSLAIKEALYRIAQEALQNAIRHARPTRLEVCLACESGSLTLEVSDDGVGFDPQADYPGHLGLQSMRERALGIGGTLEIISAPGQGTQVRARIPIPAM